MLAASYRKHEGMHGPKTAGAQTAYNSGMAAQGARPPFDPNARGTGGSAYVSVPSTYVSTRFARALRLTPRHSGDIIGGHFAMPQTLSAIVGSCFNQNLKKGELKWNQRKFWKPSNNNGRLKTIIPIVKIALNSAATVATIMIGMHMCDQRNRRC